MNTTITMITALRQTLRQTMSIFRKNSARLFVMSNEEEDSADDVVRTLSVPYHPFTSLTVFLRAENGRLHG